MDEPAAKATWGRLDEVNKGEALNRCSELSGSHICKDGNVGGMTNEDSTNWDDMSTIMRIEIKQRLLKPKTLTTNGTTVGSLAKAPLTCWLTSVERRAAKADKYRNSLPSQNSIQ